MEPGARYEPSRNREAAPVAAGFRPAANNGNETVPTVIVGDWALTNPRWTQLVRCVQSCVTVASRLTSNFAHIRTSLISDSLH